MQFAATHHFLSITSLSYDVTQEVFFYYSDVIQHDMIVQSQLFLISLQWIVGIFQDKLHLTYLGSAES